MDKRAIDQLLAPPLDREMKRYQLLAQLQQARQGFAEHKLYPHLDRLRSLVLGLRDLAEQCGRWEAALPRTLSGIDTRNMRLHYTPMVAKPVGMEVIEELMELAIPRFTVLLDDGAELRQDLVRGIRFEPIGLLPLYTTEGYLMLRQGSDARVYTYSVLHIRNDGIGSEHHNITTRYVSTWTIGLVNSYEAIKQELRRSLALPNPATFAFEAAEPLPPVETFLPLAKQLVFGALQKGTA